VSDGLVEPLNVPPGQSTPIGVQAGVSQAVVITNTLIVFGTAGGIFVSNGTPGLGNPPIFWATSASTDPFGNALPSTVGLTGSGTFKAGNTIINTSGLFIYSGTPALGNLLASFAGAAGTDSFGNVFQQGLDLNNAIILTSTATPITPAGGSVGLFCNQLGALQIVDSGMFTKDIVRGSNSGVGGTIGNVVTSTALTAAFSISPDLGGGALVEISMPFNAIFGATANETFAFQYSLNGAAAVTVASIGAALGALGVNFAGHVKLCMRIVTTGVSGAVRIWIEGGILLTAQNITTTSTATIASTVLTGIPYNSTVVNTLALFGQWGGAGGAAQNFQGLGSTLRIY
jgi:hypothetical protein